MLMKLLGVACAMAATGTVLVYGLGLQLQPKSQPPSPIAPLQSKQEAPLTTPKAPQAVATAPIHAPAEVPKPAEPVSPVSMDADYPPVATLALAQQEVPLEASITTEIAVPEELLAEDTSAEQVFVFWQPFRSRGSAQGFAQGLSARAEVPISVISEDTDAGRYYRVVLPYDSEAQRLERLAKLESATRLEMGE